MSPKTTKKPVDELSDLAVLGIDALSDDDIARIIKLFPAFFRQHLIENGFDARQAQALTTKFRDAGRRSAPWKAFSSRVAGRPQDGADGNRINRWMLPEDHKQYATERVASIVEISFFLQALSFSDAPPVIHSTFTKAWSWASDHEIVPGAYVDPIQLRSISLRKVAETPRMITSGHIYPLDRGGKHELGNVFLVLHRSNQMQGNMTLDEFLIASNNIVEGHKARGTFPNLDGQALMEFSDFLDSPHG
jgi:hypothetical protein